MIDLQAVGNAQSSAVSIMERRAGIEPASLAWKARVIASIRTPRLLGFDINELGQNAKDIFGRVFGDCRGDQIHRRSD